MEGGGKGQDEAGVGGGGGLNPFETALAQSGANYRRGYPTRRSE